jgi:uncharacterized protein GlcG (DUF336 family)
MSTTILMFAAALSATAAASPPPLRVQPELTLDAANRLAASAVAACQRDGRAIVVSVLDRGGYLLAVQRAETVGPHNVEASRRKAFTALSTRTATLDLARQAAANPDARNLNTLPELLLLGGGVPLTVAQQPVGAIGVAGGGGAANDHACAQAAIAAVAELDQPGITP